MKALYRNAVALVFPSYFGPDNLPPLEAFALGCPVIAADLPGASEQLGDGALLVSASNEFEFAQAVQRLQQDPSFREDLVLRGRKRAMSFLPSGYVREMSTILDEFSSIARCWT